MRKPQSAIVKFPFWQLIGSVLTLDLFSPMAGFGQVSVVNNGVPIRIETSAQLYVPGNYVDNSAGTEGRLNLEGTIEIAGNVENNGTTGLLTPVSLNGTIKFSGSAKQTISSAQKVYFPKLQISNTSVDGLHLSSNEFYIKNSVIFSAGNIFLHGTLITLDPSASLIGENNNSRIHGDGSVSILAGRLTSSTDYNNFAGLGLSLSTNYGSFSSVKLIRSHLPSNASPFPVANGSSLLKYYSILLLDNNNTDRFSALKISYFDPNDFGSQSISGSAMYLSNNNGTKWVKLNGSPDIPGSFISNLDVTMTGTQTNIVTIADAECDVKPGVVINRSIDRKFVGDVLKLCLNDTVTLSSDVGNEATYYKWTKADGSIVENNDLVLTKITESGSYSLYVRNDRGCEQTRLFQIDVMPLPTALFTHTPINEKSCFNEEIQFEDVSRANRTEAYFTGYLWDFDDAANTSAEANPKYKFSTVGKYDVQLIVTTNFGCKSVNTRDQDIFVNPLPIPDFNINDNADPFYVFCEDEEFELQNTSTYVDINGDPGISDDVLTYKWDFGDGPIAEPEGQHITNHTYDSYGKKIITLIATQESLLGLNTGCVSSVSKEVEIRALPRPSFEFKLSGTNESLGTDAAVCEGVDVILKNGSSIADGTAMTWEWMFGDEDPDDSPDEQESPVHEYQYSTTSPYTASLTATSSYGCYNSIVLPIIIHPAPIGDFHMEFDELAINDICTDVEVDFVNNSDIAAGTIDTYTWNFGDESGSALAAPTHSFANPRVHTISLTRTSDKNCTNIFDGHLNVHAFPDVDFVFNDVCDGLPVKFFDASDVQTDAISSYLWDFGDNGSSNQQHPEHRYATYGSYTVKLTAANTSAPNTAAKNAYSCESSVEKTVEVFQRPSFNLGPSALSCSGSFTIDPSADATAYLPAGTSFTWYKHPDFEQAIAFGDQLEVTESGSYKAVLTTDDPQNCEASFSIPVYIVDPGDLGANRTVCESTVLDATPSSVPPTGAVHYEWTKDGSPIAEIGSNLLVTESGNYSVTITYSPSSDTMTPSCSYSDNVIITIDDVPVLDLGDDVLVCQGEAATLASNISGDSYVWVNLASGDELGYDPTLEVTEAGQYRLTVEAGTCSVSDAVSVSLLPAPEAGFLASGLQVCEGEEVSFTDISFSMTASDPVVARQWDFGNGETADTSNPSTTYASSGSYTVTLEVETQNGCSDTFTRGIVVDAPPAVSFDAENACQGVSIGFTNTSVTTAFPVTYLLTFGDGTTSTQESPLHTFGQAGLFDITLKVASGKCTEEFLKQIEIYSAPDLDLAATSVTCGNQLILDAGSPGATYRWYDVASGSTLGADQTYMVTANMAIGVEVTTPNGCLLTDETTVTLNSPVQIDLGLDREVCGTITLDAGAFPNGTYAWSTGETTRKIYVTTTGLYSVSFVDQNGCTDSDEVFITVSPLPSIDLGSDITACTGSTVTLNAKNAGADFLWSTGETSQSIAVAETGTYTVRVSVGNCWVEDDILVTFLESPEVDIAFTGQCEGDAISFEPVLSNDTGILSYIWSFGDGTQSANNNPNKIFSVANTYNVSVVATNAAGCKTEVSKLVSVQPSPKPNFVFKNVCEEEELAFTNTTAYAGNLSEVSYLWDFGDGNSSEAFQPTNSYETKGRYFVTLTASTGASCERTQTKEIVVNEGPSFDLPASIETCESTYLLDAGNPGSTYKWQNNSSNRTYLATQSGTYTVRVTNTNGCAVSGAVEVTLLESELPDLGEDREACGEEVLDLGVSAASYLWSTGQTTPTITASKTGTYWVETISNDLCIHRDTVNLIVYPRPVISLGDDIVLCKGEPLTLDASSDIASSYKWSNGSTDPLLAVTSSGTYGVTLTSPKGCTFYEEIKVTVNELPTLAFADEYEACESLLLGVDNIRSEFLWSTGSTGKSIKITESDTYWLKISDRNGCVNADTTSVVIRPKPIVDLGPDVVLCYGETVEVDAGAQAGYLWNDLSTNRLKSVGATGSYTVTVTNEFGCESCV
ncbi:MAG: PKD domain-containing protein [Imperialibacter sp.]